jgi:beta-galactosidase
MIEQHTLQKGWEFRRLIVAGAEDDWESVSLPHTPFSPDLDGRLHWFGECEYRRSISMAVNAPAGSRHVLYVGAAMHTARILIDGVEQGSHTGGYLPFEVDLTTALADGKAHTLLIALDNRDTADVPPGKPYADLDFCWYGGLYRDAELRVYPPVHITDAVAAGLAGGGGVYFRTVEASTESVVARVKTHVRNAAKAPARVIVRAELLLARKSVAVATSEPVALAPEKASHVELELGWQRPRLWSVVDPVLHELRVTVCSPEGVVIDEHVERVGVRRIEFSRSGGFRINGRRTRLRGTNRHQEMPYVGYAAARTAQYRDARRIKEAGFDYVRLSHYPQSPHFLDACDELGIVVMNAIPGWQFIGGETFQDACYQNARDVIRRDRNHPCVVLWELSLNETQMPEAFMARLHAIGHEELPGDQMFTCGWMDRYDVYIHSRQHGQIHRWENGDKALVIAEYGDWEFYAANEGFDQKTGAGVHAAWSNARQFRSAGERGLRQQAWNHQIALNDTLSSPAVLDGQWSVFDYARGYHPERAACGVMDVFRLPKFSYHFYRSQRAPSEGGPGWTGGPVVFIASHWTPASELRVLVYSNCEQVELRVAGRSVGRKRPDVAWMSQHLPHPPFVFDLPCFTPGTLEATGYIANLPCAVHRASTPGKAAALELAVDELGLSPQEDEDDVVVVNAFIRDAQGTLCIEETGTVHFSVTGGGCLAGPAEVAAEAGIASTVLRLPAIRRTDGFKLQASHGGFSATLECGVSSPEVRKRGAPEAALHPV